MLTHISPEQFKTIPWKNGLGHTTELAISDDGTLDKFDWRLSIATVANDGEFSNFAGYQRNLVLIEGEGINLLHDDTKLDKLNNLLEVANFDGGSKTYGTLANGTIKDFNIMSNQQSFNAKVDTYTGAKQLCLNPTENTLYFIYSLTSETKVQASEQSLQLPVGHLAKIESSNTEVVISGKDMIVIQLNSKL